MMKIKNKRKSYSVPEIGSLVMEGRESLLAASVIIDTQIINSVGQELGPTYDFAKEVDENTGKTFSHEWEAGIGEGL